MFARITTAARRVLDLAREEASRLDHNAVGREHIFLGLIAEGEGVAAKALESLGISLGSARATLDEIGAPGGSTRTQTPHPQGRA